MIVQRPDSKIESGYTLVEVLVAFVVLSIGLLGLATLQGVSLQGSNKSFARSIAMVQAYDMADRIRANMAGVTQGAYDSLPVAGSVDYSCLATGCSPGFMAAIDGDEWSREIAARLPSGEGAVTRLPTTATVAAPIFQIDVGWQETSRSLLNTMAGDEDIEESCDDALSATTLTCFRLEFSP